MANEENYSTPNTGTHVYKHIQYTSHDTTPHTPYTTHTYTPHKYTHTPHTTHIYTHIQHTHGRYSCIWSPNSSLQTWLTLKFLVVWKPTSFILLALKAGVRTCLLFFHLSPLDENTPSYTLPSIWVTKMPRCFCKGNRYKATTHTMYNLCRKN